MIVQTPHGAGDERATRPRRRRQLPLTLYIVASITLSGGGLLLTILAPFTWYYQELFVSGLTLAAVGSIPGPLLLVSGKLITVDARRVSDAIRIAAGNAIGIAVALLYFGGRMGSEYASALASSVGAAIGLIGGALPLLIGYLQGPAAIEAKSGPDDASDLHDPVTKADIDKLNDRVEQLTQSVGEAELGNGDGIVPSITRVARTLRFERARSDMQQRNAQDAVMQLSAVTRARLLQQSSDLSRRTNVNLAIGIIATTIALIITAFLVFGSRPQDMTQIAALSYYIPRVSLAVFVEVFAFFFLRLYRAGLEDIKHYQNELSNVELWTLAVQAAFDSANASAISNVIKSLASTERNFKLDRGQSTVALERAKMESNEVMSGLTEASSFLQRLTGKS